MKQTALPLVLMQWTDAEARLIARWKYLTESALPTRARREHWTVRLDHCFKRVCLDFAFQDVWYKHLRKPAEKHLQGESLQRAVQCAEEILVQGKPLLLLRNRESLAYRGKLKAAAQKSSASE